MRVSLYLVRNRFTSGCHVTGLHQVVMVFSTSQVYIRLSWYLVRNRFTSGLSWYLVTGLRCHGIYYVTGLHQVVMVFSTSQVYIRLSWYLVRNRFTSSFHGI